MSGTAIPANLGGALGFNVHRLGLLFRRHLIRTLRDYDLTPEQWQVLAALAASSEPLSQTELCYVTLKDRHSMSRMLAKLETAGWVRRAPDAEDERIVRVSPTARTRREVPKIRALLEQAFAPALTALPKSEHERLLRSLKTLTRVMEELA